MLFAHLYSAAIAAPRRSVVSGRSAEGGPSPGRLCRYRVRPGPARLRLRLRWREVLAFLEEETRRGVPGALEVIGTSFLYRLPYEEQPGYGIEAHLGPAMRQVYLAIRPWYGAQASGAPGVPDPGE
ncbi:hypothetical protein ACIA6E_30185 [Streptomyces sp. NPDC051815]|uniref:hypothetical protein n=1 Tax=Streptomyces sp. NPDC051815 TaxID=3365674 RepID=UPI0037A836FC